MRKKTLYILLIGLGLYVLWDWYQFKTSRLFYYPKSNCVESAKYKDVPLEKPWSVYVCKVGDTIKTEILMDPKKLER